MWENAKKKDIYLDTIGGFSDHVHCLISLNKNHSLSKLTQLIKGESSHWINQKNLVEKYFNWQDDYWAVGVSESHLKAVRKYIKNQEEHHKKKTFAEELDEFMNKYGWEFIRV
jgi:REP element-mobilizing transposase RayT